MSRCEQVLELLVRLRTQMGESDARARQLDVILDLASDLAESSKGEAARVARLEALLADMRAAEQAQSELLTSVTHEIRNALTPILATTELLGIQGGAFARHSAILQRHTRHLQLLVDNVMAVAHTTRSREAMQKSLVDVEDSLARAVELVSPFAVAGEIVLSARGEGDRLFLHADRDRLILAFTNLLMSAINVTLSRGRIGIETEATDDTVIVRVIATGTGAEGSPRTPEPSSRARRMTAHEALGADLGLKVVKNVIELHGGAVDVTSDGPGLTSTFVVRMPRARAEDSAELKTMPDASLYAAPQDLQGRTVLVVDDHADAAETVAAMLERMGCAVHVAHDGPEALEVARSVRPDVVLLDLDLPGMDGYDVGRRLRSDGALSATKLVAMTGHGDSAARRRARSAGMDMHVVKPVDSGQLFEAVRES